MDLDGDSQISFDEFQSAMLASMGQQDSEMLETAFNSLDANNDGFVDFYELSGCLQGNAEAFNKVRGHNQF